MITLACVTTLLVYTSSSLASQKHQEISRASTVPPQESEPYDYLDSLADGQDYQITDRPQLPSWTKRSFLALIIRLMNISKHCERSWDSVKRSWKSLEKRFNTFLLDHFM